MLSFLTLLRSGCLSAAILAVPTMRALEIKLPEETARLAESPLPGFALATTYCYTCHSTDYVSMQPPSVTRAAWRASVVKMQKTFGAPIPDNVIDPIADYLVKTYGAERGAANTAPTGSTQPAGSKK